MENMGLPKKYSLALGIIALVALLAWAKAPIKDPETWGESTPLYEAIRGLGGPKYPHELANSDTALWSQGYDLVHKGFTERREGGKSKYISKFFQCTHCHNTEIEDPDLAVSDPESRLAYSVEKGLPFLQGTTFYGAVNRESWYNGDYIQKYGDLVLKANESIRESIQLCAQECAQGRLLEQWEEDAILAYLWRLEYKLGDLSLSDAEMEALRKAASGNEKDRQGAISLLKSKYAKASPATFADAPYNKRKGYKGIEGRASNGKLVYEQACQHCHKPYGVSDFVMDDSKLTMRMLVRNLDKNNKQSIYQAVRYGTYATPGHRPYMPNYTLERMSHQQLEDLRAYIVVEAGMAEERP